MKNEFYILDKIETTLLDKRINYTGLAVLVSRNKSTISKFFNRKYSTRSRELMVEILEVLQIPYKLDSQNKILIIEEIKKVDEKTQYMKWLKCIGVKDFCKKKYEIVKKIIRDI